MVRAVAGDRVNYQAIETPLAPATAAPIDVARALVQLVPDCGVIYVADLDGIMQQTPQVSVVEALSTALSDVRILLDDGLSDVEAAGRWHNHPRIMPVIGTEILASATHYGALADALNGEFTLSLDHRGLGRLGPDDVFDDADAWPAQVIVMDLAQVGTGGGVDLARLQAIKAAAGERSVLAAGGVRVDDFARIAGLHCGVLISRALHAGELSHSDIAMLQSL